MAWTARASGTVSVGPGLLPPPPFPRPGWRVSSTRSIRHNGARCSPDWRRLSARDPFIRIRQDDARREVAVSLYGQVQQEVLAARLADGWGVRVSFRNPTVVCIERVTGTGEAAEVIASGDNPYLATVGLRVGPAPAGSGLRYLLEVEPGSLPASFRTALADGVRDTLATGGPHGWCIPDAQVTLTRSGYWARQSHAHATFDKAMSSVAGDFRSLARLVLADALVRAGTQVCEPVHRALLDLPAPALRAVLTAVARVGGVPGAPDERGGRVLLPADIPAASIPELARALPRVDLRRRCAGVQLRSPCPRPGSRTRSTAPRAGPVRPGLLPPRGAPVTPRSPTW